MIPKIIHYCWFGKNEIPEKDKKCIASWKKYCPDYQIIEWNEDNYDVSKCEYMKEAYSKKYWGFVPDYARLDIIYQFGGIYLDTDVELIKSFDSLLENRVYVGVEKNGKVALGLGFGAEPNNLIIKKLLDTYEKLNFSNEDGSVNLVASPTYITKTLEEIGYKIGDKDQKIGELQIYPSQYLSPMCFETGRINITDNTYSIHWYNASWMSIEEKKKWEYFRKINRIFGMKIGMRINYLINLVINLTRKK
ncbi:MAG: glycosyltransferase [Bacilli bacterium]|uniref:glycosyltransferase family 32 protein n=1 Tax=Anaerorhabdus sp. TaxID=1872524 RepID=UPI002FCB8295